MTSADASAHVSKPCGLAVVLYGKVGTENKRAGMHPQALAQPSLIALSILSLKRHVISPARERFHTVEAFVHSWNPEAGSVIDALLDPRTSAHEPDRSAELEARCAAGNFSFVKLTCGRTWSQMLSIQRAIGLKAEREAQAGWRFDLVYVGRIDLLWRRSMVDLLVRACSTTPGEFVFLPEQCGVVRPPKARKVANATRRWREQRCDGAAGPTIASQAAASCMNTRNTVPNVVQCGGVQCLEGRSAGGEQCEKCNALNRSVC